jgi:hypothetical protein
MRRLAPEFRFSVQELEKSFIVQFLSGRLPAPAWLLHLEKIGTVDLEREHL